MTLKRWTLPLVTAAVLHGVAFFGLNAPAKLPPPDPGRVRVEPSPVALVEEVIEIPENEAAGQGPSRPTVGPPQAEDVVREFKSDVWMATITPDVITPNAAVVFDHLPPMRMAPGIGPGAGPGGGVESVDGLDRVPRTRLQASPVYPYEARKDGRGGEVIVAFTVDEQGRVVNPVVVRSTDPAFEGPTLRAVARWRFEPGRKNGRVVRFRLAVPVQFALNENQ